MNRAPQRLSLAVFDLDGTLIELEIEHVVDHIVSFLTARKLAVPTRDRIRHLLRAHRYEEIFPEEGRARIALESWDSYDPRTTPTPKLFDGTLATLEEMVSRGFELAIATARTMHTEELREVLRPTGILKHVEFLSTWYKTGWTGKVEQLRGVCREHSLPPAAAMMVGDSCDDIRSSRAVGFGLNIALRSGMHLEEMLVLEEPHYVIDSVTEVPKTVDRFSGEPRQPLVSP
jgi:phosphoglycolate phosphatase-like HAD superfamily hydrolase